VGGGGGGGGAIDGKTLATLTLLLLAIASLQARKHLGRPHPKGK
jgi:hypothetical protein